MQARARMARIGQSGSPKRRRLELSLPPFSLTRGMPIDWALSHWRVLDSTVIDYTLLAIGEELWGDMFAGVHCRMLLFYADDNLRRWLLVREKRGEGNHLKCR